MTQGERIGDFRVLGVHPGGGFRAMHVGSPQRVLIDIRTNDDWRAQAVQILRATQILDLLAHPGMARIVAHGVLPDHRRWVASELADGLALSEIIERRRLSTEETTNLVRDVADVLAVAHDAGVVHGSLRLHKIVIATGARAFPVQVGGWGDLRAPGTIADLPELTPLAAPEISRGVSDGRADVFALGAIAYRAITGRYPSVIPPALVPGVPAALSDLICRMLANDPDDRPSADEVHAMARALTGDRVRATPRFTRPRWTPAPLPVVERREVSEVIELVTLRPRS